MDAFRTHDLPLAATLLHEKYRLLDLDRTSPTVKFIFEDSEDLRGTVDRFFRNDLLCPAQSLLASLRQAKHVLYDHNK